MDQTAKLLNCVAENARTGAEATDQLMHRTEDAKMRSELMFQRDLYHGAQRDAESHLNEIGEKADTTGPMAKAGMWAGIKMNTAIDKTNSHLADIMIQGATMGVIQTTKARNECPDADAEAQGTASAFITQQQDAIERMKQFLV